MCRPLVDKAGLVSSITTKKNYLMITNEQSIDLYSIKTIAHEITKKE